MTPKTGNATTSPPKIRPAARNRSIHGALRIDQFKKHALPKTQGNPHLIGGGRIGNRNPIRIGETIGIHEQTPTDMIIGPTDLKAVLRAIINRMDAHCDGRR